VYERGESVYRCEALFQPGRSLSLALEGRAIRHQRDWASLVLVDTRYSLPQIRDKLPSWISSGVKVTGTFGVTMKMLGEFYKGKR